MITKFIPKGVTRAVGRASLQASKNSPKYLFLGGVIGTVGATVLACRATLKVESVLVEHEKMVANINQAVTFEQYSEKDMQHDKLVLYIQTTVKLTKLYGPAVILGSVSIAALTKSHNLMQSRNAALSAAYAGLEATFGNYRERVRTELGEEKEKEIYRDVRTEIVKINGKDTEIKFAGPQGSSMYAELYSSDTNHNFQVGSIEANIMTLRQRENYLNDRLRMRGHLYLNEVLEELGFDHTEEGSVVGWLYKPEDPTVQSYVTFMCWADNNRDQIDPMMMNNADGIFLDFNVIGEIWKRLDEVKPIWKHTDKALRRARTRNW